MWYVAEETKGLQDDELLRKAAAENALLLTSDKDFGVLVFRQGKATAGVLLLRLAGVPTQEKDRIVVQAAAEYEGELQGAFSVLTRDALRVRSVLDDA